MATTLLAGWRRAAARHTIESCSSSNINDDVTDDDGAGPADETNRGGAATAAATADNGDLSLFKKLPREMLRHIFSVTEGPTAVACAQVCKLWSEIAEADFSRRSERYVSWVNINIIWVAGGGQGGSAV